MAVKYIDYVPNNVSDIRTTHMKIEVFYCAGGINYGTYKKDPQGICLRLLPVSLRFTETMRIESFGGFTGQSYLLEELSRKSAKKLAQWEGKIMSLAENIHAVYLESGYAGVKTFLETL